jgi:hypothetical protein
MDAFPIDEEADLKSVGAKGPFGEKVMQASYGGRCLSMARCRQFQDDVLCSMLLVDATGVLDNCAHLAAPDTGGRGLLGRLHR